MKNKLKFIYKKLFSGRLGNIYFLFALLIIYLVQFFLDPFISKVSNFSFIIYHIIFAILLLSLEIRRLHDLKLPGNIAVIVYFVRMFVGGQLAQPILILGYVFDIYLMFASGDKHTNKYGEKPKLEKKFINSVFNQ